MIDTKLVPLVSVGVPVFNGAKYLTETLESILSQTYPNIEILISDNGSTDNTPIICLDYAKKDPRVKYEKQPTNKGAAFNFLNVLTKATGTYFMWAAADDLWEKNYIATLVDEFGPDDLSVTSKVCFIDGEGKKTSECTLKAMTKENFLGALVNTPHLALRAYGLFNRILLLKQDLSLIKEPIIGIDRAIINQLVWHGDMQTTSKTTFFYRVHADNASGKLRSSKLQYAEYLFTPLRLYYYSIKSAPTYLHFFYWLIYPYWFLYHRQSELMSVLRKYQKILRLR